MATQAEALMKFLAQVANRLGVGKHVYVVGGAVRNWLLGIPPKDIDVVIDSVALNGKDSDWFAGQVQRAIPVRTSLVTNQYGVAILTVSGEWDLNGFPMQGEVIEIANTRKESYGKGDGPGKGYKPDVVEPAGIRDDLVRREFTFNTLLWRLADLENGPDLAEVLDMLGTGRADLETRTMRTPVDPDKTFGDDPTRMLRALKFVAKYGFKIPADVRASIARNAPGLKNMPWNAVWKILVEDILEGPAPRKSVALLHELGLGEVIKEMFHEEKGFAAGVAGRLNDKDAHLLLDLLDLGWAVRTPLSFLNRADQVRLREILLANATEGGFDRNFVDILTKPGLDQQRLFVEYQIPPKERGVVVQVAREALLRDPDLSRDVRTLEGVVEDRIKDRFQRTASIVVARFLGSA